MLVVTVEKYCHLDSKDEFQVNWTFELQLKVDLFYFQENNFWQQYLPVMTMFLPVILFWNTNNK